MCFGSGNFNSVWSPRDCSRANQFIEAASCRVVQINAEGPFAINTSAVRARALLALAPAWCLGRDASGVEHLRRTRIGSGIALTNIRTGLGTDAIAKALIDNLYCLQAKLPQHATRNDRYMALAYTVRDRMMERYIATVESITQTNTAAKRFEPPGAASASPGAEVPASVYLSTLLGNQAGAW
jgi:hypothetical protein